MIDNKYNIAIAMIKGVIASIPMVGPFAVEIVNITIPNQRQERLEKLLKILSEKVSDLDSKQLEQRFSSTNFIDIFEDVLHQSIRATTDERLEYLASVVDFGLRQEELDHFKIKRLLKIFAEINDAEVIILESYCYSSIADGREFKDKHLNIFNPPEDSDKQSEEHEAMLKNYISNLINLGLVGSNDFLGSSHMLITRLGIMLLEEIGVWQDREVFSTGDHVNPIDAINTAHKDLKKTEERIRKELELETKKAIGTIQGIVSRITRR
jgi:hypothetical protein